MGNSKSAPLAPNTDVSGSINVDTTWRVAGSPYRLIGDVTVVPGVALTIEAGVAVMGNSGTRLLIQGQLTAIGTSEQTILFTSSTNSGPNQWVGLVFDQGKGVLEHVTVRYAGTGIVVSGQQASLSVSASQINSNAGYGIVGSQNAGPLQLTVTNSTFNANANTAIHVAANANAPSNAVINVTGNSFTGNGGYPLALAGNGVVTPALTFSGNTLSGNGGNSVNLSGLSLGTMTLPAIPGTAYTVDTLTVPAGRTLTLPPDTVVKFHEAGVLNVLGGLRALGTAAAPVVFTSSKDDTVAGDTNNDGANSSPAYDNWSRIRITAGAAATLDYVQLRYAGRNYGDWRAGLSNEQGTVSIDHSVFSQNHVYGLSQAGGTTSVARTTFQDNEGRGVYVDNGLLDIRECDFYRNKTAGLSARNSDVRVESSAFTGNAGFGIQNLTPQSVIHAANNWWGHPSGPNHPSLNPDGEGDPVSDGVAFIPWLERPLDLRDYAVDPWSHSRR